LATLILVEPRRRSQPAIVAVAVAQFAASEDASRQR
jgi:hypothetical protein